MTKKQWYQHSLSLLNWFLFTFFHVFKSIQWLKSLSRVWLFATPWTIYSPWNSPGRNTGVGSLSLLQGIFPTQGLNPGLPHCRRILYQLSHQGSLFVIISSVFMYIPWATSYSYFHLGTVFFLFFIKRWIGFCLCRVFVASHGLSLVAEKGVCTSLWYRPSRCGGVSWGTQAPGCSASAAVTHGFSQSPGSMVVAKELNCSMTCGIFPHQGLNLRLLN